MTTHAFRMKLKPGVVDEYRRRGRLLEEPHRAVAEGDLGPARVEREHVAGVVAVDQAGAAVGVVGADCLEIRRAVLRSLQAVGEQLLEPEDQPRRHAVGGLDRRVGPDPLVVPGLDSWTEAERRRGSESPLTFVTLDRRSR